MYILTYFVSSSAFLKYFYFLRPAHTRELAPETRSRNTLLVHFSMLVHTGELALTRDLLLRNPFLIFA